MMFDDQIDGVVDAVQIDVTRDGCLRIAPTVPGVVLLSPEDAESLRDYLEEMIERTRCNRNLEVVFQ